MKQIFLLLFSTILTLSAWSTHNRAGEITYRWLGNTTYEFTVTTYTKTSAPADRNYLPVLWDDGSGPDSIPRVSEDTSVGNDIKKNVYIKEHTFPGTGTYDVCFSDPNRNSDIINISNSVLVPFGITTKLIISLANAPNTSVVLDNPPIQDGCIYQPWIFNPAAFDADGDSLSYSLVNNQGIGCMPLDDAAYGFPDEFPSGPDNNLSINSSTGTITWISPQIQGEYNIAILIKEWRNGNLVGQVLRDMQITIYYCDNLPPDISAVQDTCIQVDQLLQFDVTATDPDPEDNLTLHAFGGPLLFSNSPATFNQVSAEPVVSSFEWMPACNAVRKAPYQVVFEANDNSEPVELIDISTANITVVAPAPENLTAEALPSGIQLNWDQSFCSSATGYKIYRRIDEYGFEPDTCETGVPAYTGYVEIEELDGLENTSYLDQDEVLFGRKTCYMVIAVFPDDAESYASEEVCAEIKFVIPLITKVSIGETDESGRDTLNWVGPVELDTIVYPGPYSYRIFRGEGFTNVEEVVFETNEEDELNELPQELITEPLNTIDTAHVYRVELYSDGEPAGRSNAASNIFLSLTPNDNEMDLNWQSTNAWINFRYDIFRLDEGGEFEFLNSTTETTYTDTALVNNSNYCYYIVAYGSYFAVQQNDTLINYSQINCSSPYDRTAPCPPALSMEDNCRDLFVEMQWTNPNEECADTDDVMQYNIYFSPTEGGEMQLLETIEGNGELNWIEYFENSIAGCYAVTALDSLNLHPDGVERRNESVFSNPICIDNCPQYEIPNVITPNGDGKNDYLLPFVIHSIESVEFTMYNRWGGVVFETTEKDLRWNGINQETGEMVIDGTYFYTCKVYSIRLSGLEPINLSGYVQVFSDRNTITD